ncbi:MAG: hypothetical protein D6762_06075, partial [Candidatus Neomarinimicrobiota bacterium]
AQSVKLQGQIFEYTTYYISSFNIQTGASDVQLFRYQLYEESGTYPVWVKVWFRASMVSPSLGITEPTTIVEVGSQPFQLQAPLIIDNRDISLENQVLYDLANPPNPVTIPVSSQDVSIINPAQFDQLLSSIMTSGRLPDGEYTVEIKVYAGNTDSDLSLTDEQSHTITIRTPTGVTLESPGGALADTSQNLLYTLYPVFNWYAQPCLGCENYIRVAEFIPGVHSTPEEAIEDELSLPFDPTQEWEPTGTFSTYQYPLSGARPLEYGHVYVWQIKQLMVTTAGAEEILSPIYAFKIVNPAAGAPESESVPPLVQALQEALGEGQFEALLGASSSLEGFVPSGQYTINGVAVDEATLNYIINEIINQNLVVTGVEVEE